MLLDASAERSELAELRVAQDVAPSLEHGARSRVDRVVVWIHRTRDELLSEAPYRLDRGATAAPGDRVGREEHARALCLDHSLHDDREPESTHRDLMCLAIGDGAVVPERRPAAADGIENRVRPGHTEDRVLLAGEARIGQVLGRRRGTDRDGRRAERAVRLAGRVRDPGRDR